MAGRSTTVGLLPADPRQRLPGLVQSRSRRPNRHSLSRTDPDVRMNKQPRWNLIATAWSSG